MGTIIDFATRQPINPEPDPEPAPAPIPAPIPAYTPIPRLSTAETAKLVRAAVKAAFPGVTFSVRSRVYSGGASIDVDWTDGPTSKMVDPIIKRFERHTNSTLDGQRVHFGADHIMSKRDNSAALLRECAAIIAKQYDIDAPTVNESTSTYGGKKHTHAWVERTTTPLDPWNMVSTASDKVVNLAHNTSKWAEPAK